MLSWKAILSLIAIALSCLYAFLSTIEDTEATKEKILLAWESLIKEPDKKFTRISVGYVWRWAILCGGRHPPIHCRQLDCLLWFYVLSTSTVISDSSIPMHSHCCCTAPGRIDQKIHLCLCSSQPQPSSSTS